MCTSLQQRSSTVLLVYIVIQIQAVPGHSQCLTGPNDNYDDNIQRPTLPNNSQALVTTYKFNCCGSITRWKALISPRQLFDGNTYHISFQVWRPSPNDCYNLVGQNNFQPTLLSEGRVSVSVFQNHIMVEPGDVVGFKMLSAVGGIQLDNVSHMNNTVWYGQQNQLQLTECQLRIGPNTQINSTLLAAPVIGVELMSSPCFTVESSPSSTSNTAPNLKNVESFSFESPMSSHLPTPTSSVRNNSLLTVMGVLITFIVMLITIIVSVSFVFILIKQKPTKVNTSKVIKISHDTQIADEDNRHPLAMTSHYLHYENAYMNDNEVPPNYETCIQKMDYESDEMLVPSSSITTTLMESGECTHSLTDNILSKDENHRNYTVVGLDHSANESNSSSLESQCHASEMDRADGRDSLELEDSSPVIPCEKETKEILLGNVKTSNRPRFFENEATYWVPANTPEALYNQLALRKYREIPRKDIRMLKCIGSGQFGLVSKAMWTTESITVAIKQLRSNASSTERLKLLQEGAIMGQFNHSNVVKLYGLVSVSYPVCICLEYMKNGDLSTYLKSLPPNNPLPPAGYKDIRVFFVQAARNIASGMTYLSSKAFIHRDLAARNILLNELFICKIGDFGMSRDLADEAYYTSAVGGQIPIRWTAPEALLHRKYSSASDIWSFGMVLYEIWSLGKRPFYCLDNAQVVQVIKQQYCQSPPPGCPRAMYKLMVDCWNPDYRERPKFWEIANFLRQPLSILVYWCPNDSKLCIGIEELGGDLNKAEKLYLDLQKKY